MLLIDYWATWCVPCMQAMPGVVAAWQRYRGQGLKVIGIALDAASSCEKVLEVVRAQGIGSPQIFDGLGTKSELMTKNRVTAIPALFLIDRQGRVRWTDLEGEELMRRAGELIAEK